MKNPKTVIFITLIYLGFSLVIGYDVYRGLQKLHIKLGEIAHGNPKIPKP